MSKTTKSASKLPGNSADIKRWAPTENMSEEENMPSN
jgi:hypothetical protein